MESQQCHIPSRLIGTNLDMASLEITKCWIIRPVLSTSIPLDSQLSLECIGYYHCTWITVKRFEPSHWKCVSIIIYRRKWGFLCPKYQESYEIELTGARGLPKITDRISWNPIFDAGIFRAN